MGASEALAYGLERTAHSHPWRLRSQPDSAQATLATLQGRRGPEGSRPDDGDALVKRLMPTAGSAPSLAGDASLEGFGSQFRERVSAEVAERRAEFAGVFRKMRGRSLPKPLRRFLWRWMLSSEAQVEMVAQQLARACATQRVEDPTRTDLADLIEATTLSRVREVVGGEGGGEAAGTTGADGADKGGRAGRGGGVEAGSDGRERDASPAPDPDGDGGTEREGTGEAAAAGSSTPQRPSPPHTRAVRLALAVLNMFYVLTGQQRESHASVAVALTHVLCDHNSGPGDAEAHLSHAVVVRGGLGGKGVPRLCFLSPSLPPILSSACSWGWCRGTSLALRP